MDLIKIKIPFKLANLGIEMQYVDKISLYEAVEVYCKDKPAIVTEDLVNRSLEDQFWFDNVDIFEESATVVMTHDLYNTLISSGAAASLAASYYCNLSPCVSIPVWKVVSIEKELLTVTVQAHISDFIDITSEDTKCCGRCDGNCQCHSDLKED